MIACFVPDCGRPAHQDAVICRHHADQLAQNLGDIPALAEQLDLTLSRQTASGGRVGGRSAEKPLPFDYGASEAIAILRTVVGAWTRELIHVHKLSDSPAATLVAHSRWLLARHPALVGHASAHEAVDEFDSAMTNGWAAVDRAADLIYAGRCGVEPPEGGPTCDRDLYAHPYRTWVTCRSCGASHIVSERKALMVATVWDELMTVREIARLAAFSGEFPETRRTADKLDKWVERGLLIGKGVDRHGRETYPYGEVVELLRKSPTRRRSA